MRALNRLGSALAAVALTAATAAAFADPASAATARDSFPGAGHAVFVQTDAAAGNRVVAYHRSGGGKLTWAHSYSTDGLGGTVARTPRKRSTMNLAARPRTRKPMK